MGGPGSGRKKTAETIQREMEAQEAVATAAGLPPAPMIVLTKVTQPTGSTIEVQGAQEAIFYDAQKTKYLHENKYDAVSDLADLDALLMHELLDFRYTSQLASGKSYEGLFLEYRAEEQLRQNKISEAKVIGDIKRQLGLNRASRDASAGSTADYIKNLLVRAKSFGVNRDRQIMKAVVLANELKSIVQTYDRSNDTEKRVVGIETEADIVAWVRAQFIPGFDAVDLAFRENQRLWVGQL